MPFCLVCGHSANEVDRLHYFPANLERSRQWQESMCMRFVGESLRGRRICSRHFTPECYINNNLRPQAIPTLFPCDFSLTESVLTSYKTKLGITNEVHPETEAGSSILRKALETTVELLNTPKSALNEKASKLLKSTAYNQPWEDVYIKEERNEEEKWQNIDSEDDVKCLEKRPLDSLIQLLDAKIEVKKEKEEEPLDYRDNRRSSQTFLSLDPSRNNLGVGVKEEMDVIEEPLTDPLGSPETQAIDNFVGIKQEQDVAEQLLADPLDEEDQEEHVKRRRKSRTGKFRCDQCAYATNRSSNLTSHTILNHKTEDEIVWYDCPHCPKKMKLKQHLYAHLRDTHNKVKKWFTCAHCDYRTKLKISLTNHEISLHMPSDTIKWFQCDQCKYKSRINRLLQNHIKRKHSEIFLTCDFCPFKTRGKPSLKKHQLREHEGRIEWLKCNLCDVKYRDESSLKYHKLLHEKKAAANTLSSEYVCSVCGFKTISRNAFNNHHHNEDLINDTE